LQEIYRQVHTFKGVFNQFSLEKTPVALHALEEQLDDLRSSVDHASPAQIARIFQSAQLIDTLERDLAVVRKALGDSFLDKGGQVTMTLGQAAEIKRLATKWRQGQPIDLAHPDVQRILDEIDKVGTVSLKAELASYDQTIAQVALRLNKEVSPLEVYGEDFWLDPDIFGPFLRSLIHVFRNCVTHGIELPEVRLERGKEEFGTISCSVKSADKSLVIEIADDGAGVDTEALRATLRQQGSLALDEIGRLSDQQIANHIFQDSVSTAHETDEWSGRGVGLAAVHREIERLDGTAEVETVTGHGTRFIFSVRLPYRA
jgi:chemotaxis protein histidine kinase CheA